MTEIEISCPIYPSEDPLKVEKAVLNIFPDAEIQFTENEISAEAHSMEHFSKLIRKQKILDATRRILKKGKRGNVTRFFLNKQIAFAGRVSFCEEETVLGTIKVVVKDEEMEALIENVSPETVDGEEVLI